MDQRIRALVEGVVAAHFQRQEVREQLERCVRTGEAFVPDEALWEQLLEVVEISGLAVDGQGLEAARELLRDLQLGWGEHEVAKRLVQ